MKKVYRVQKQSRERNVYGNLYFSCDHVIAGNVRGAMSQARLHDPGCLIIKVTVAGKVVYEAEQTVS